jgi:hypothetical protein
MPDAAGPTFPKKLRTAVKAQPVSATGMVVLGIAALVGAAVWEAGRDWPDHLPAEGGAFRAFVSDRVRPGQGRDAFVGALSEVGISDCRYVASDPAAPPAPDQLTLRCARTASRTPFSGTIWSVTATFEDGRAIRITAKVETVWP